MCPEPPRLRCVAIVAGTDVRTTSECTSKRTTKSDHTHRKKKKRITYFNCWFSILFTLAWGSNWKIISFKLYGRRKAILEFHTQYAMQSQSAGDLDRAEGPTTAPRARRPTHAARHEIPTPADAYCGSLVRIVSHGMFSIAFSRRPLLYLFTFLSLSFAVPICMPAFYFSLKYFHIMVSFFARIETFYSANKFITIRFGGEGYIKTEMIKYFRQFYCFNRKFQSEKSTDNH